MSELPKEPYKGMRDFYPHNMFVLRYIFDVWRKVAERYGYEEYSSATIESIDLYRAKSGDEIANEQTYSFLDRAGREVTLRPEMTPSLARMIAAKKRSYILPIRWYSIPNLFRYERPQRGRFREHWQLNIDMFGTATVESEVEVIILAHSIMREFRFKQEDYEIHINSRVLLAGEFEKAGIRGEEAKKLMKLLDKKDKMEDFDAKAEELIGKPFTFNLEASETIKKILSLLEEQGIKNISFVPTLVRGFDYYTDIVFEVFDTHPDNKRSLFGGGRYDNLLEIFGEKPIPAVGFGMGDATLHDALEVHGLLPHYHSSAHLLLCTVDKESIPYAQSLASRLRAGGINVVVNLTDKSVGDQIKKADSDHIPYVLCIGDNEKSSGLYMLKNLESGEEYQLEESSLVSHILEKEEEKI